MSTNYQIVIIGSGPAGLSAAAQARRRGVTHLLLERADHLNDTIFSYQLQKLVMATPEPLQNQSALAFAECSREKVLGDWNKLADQAGINYRLNAEVASVFGERGAFTIELANGESLTAENVVIAIGTQGSVKKLHVPGSDLSLVQYELRDPSKYQGRRIVVIGAGDTGIENALALSVNNEVVIINSHGDFKGAKTQNRRRIEAKIAKGYIEARLNAKTTGFAAGTVMLKLSDKEQDVECDLAIVRIGADPPTAFFKACKITVPEVKDAHPAISDRYESCVPGLYVIGAAAGIQLIKHCLNQGCEVVESILGNDFEPADTLLIKKTIEQAGVEKSVLDLLEEVARLPLFKPLTRLQIREALVHCQLRPLAPGEFVFRRGEYPEFLYAVLQGEIGIESRPGISDEVVRFGPGQFFGEMALIAGRRHQRNAKAIKESLILAIDQSTMARLIRTNDAVKQEFDRTAILRYIKLHLAPEADEEILSEVVATAKVCAFEPNYKNEPKYGGDVLIQEGDEDHDFLYLIRRGLVSLDIKVNNRDVVFEYARAGHFVGGFAALRKAARSATMRAVTSTEAIQLDGSILRRAFASRPQLQQQVEARLADDLKSREQLQAHSETGDLVAFLMREGIGEATNALLIDESLCTRCNNCEDACAETHDGNSRLDRETGPTFAMLHVPTSCRHCEHPHCMKDCPPDAIHRAPNGEVYIEDTCIGCGNCEEYCPYGVIKMAMPQPEKPPLWRWFLFGSGPGLGENRATGCGDEDGAEHGHAVKCDLCEKVGGGPACVRSCPTGAAIRVDAESYIEVLRRQRPAVRQGAGPSQVARGNA
jgi:thioredoxin reductase/Fe-S-cluster-containing hydrogenase component 2/CRP-like cAMP-binding protein